MLFRKCAHEQHDCHYFKDESGSEAENREKLGKTTGDSCNARGFSARSPTKSAEEADHRRKHEEEKRNPGKERAPQKPPCFCGIYLVIHLLKNVTLSQQNQPESTASCLHCASHAACGMAAKSSLVPHAG